MFETNELAKIEIPTTLSSPGEHVWGYVYSRLNLYWLHIVARSRFEEDGFQELRIFFVSQVDDLIAINQSFKWEIKEVSLVSPSHMNKSGHWKMDLLDEILVDNESLIEHEQYGYVFVLSNGQRYADSINSSENEHIELISVYRAESN